MTPSTYTYPDEVIVETPRTQMLPHFGSPRISNPYNQRFSFIVEELDSLSPIGPRRETLEHVYASQKQWALSPPRGDKVFLVQAGMWCWLCSNAYLGYILEDVLHISPPVLKCQRLLSRLYRSLLNGDKHHMTPIDRTILAKSLTEEVSETRNEMEGGYAWKLLMNLEKEAFEFEQHVVSRRGL